MRKFILIIWVLIVFLACNRTIHESISWKKNTKFAIDYIIQVDDKIMALEVGRGLLYISEVGKVNTKIFKKDDERTKLTSIKLMNNSDSYALYYLDKTDIWVVKLRDGFYFDKVIKVPENAESFKDFLISDDGKMYSPLTTVFTNEGQWPHEWIDIKTGEVLGQFEYFSSANKRLYLIKNSFYQNSLAFITMYDVKGKEIKTAYLKELFNSDNYSLGNYDDLVFNDFIYGNDGFFYIIPNNWVDGKSWSYYLVKLDKELNLIGKRRVDLEEQYDDRCTSSIFVDEDGFIYVASDKEMTITKFKPIEDGEDSLVDLRG